MGRGGGRKFRKFSLAGKILSIAAPGLIDFADHLRRATKRRREGRKRVFFSTI